MALKDITLGQYFPGHTVVHRLDPRVKLIGTVVYIVALFLARGLLTYGWTSEQYQFMRSISAWLAQTSAGSQVAA